MCNSCKDIWRFIDSARLTEECLKIILLVDNEILKFKNVDLSSKTHLCSCSSCISGSEWKKRLPNLNFTYMNREHTVLEIKNIFIFRGLLRIYKKDNTHMYRQQNRNHKVSICIIKILKKNN